MQSSLSRKSMDKVRWHHSLMDCGKIKAGSKNDGICRNISMVAVVENARGWVGPGESHTEFTCRYSWFCAKDIDDTVVRSE